MLRKQKFSFYFKHLLLMSTVNRIRLILTSIGIFVAVFLFSVGVIITNSFYSGNLKIIDEMSNNTAVISSNLETDVAKEKLADFTTIRPVEDMLLNEKISILSTSVSDRSYLTVMAKIHGITNSSKTLPVISDDGLFLPTNATLLKGRYITSQDLTSKSNVVIIDEFTANLLYPDEDAIGKTIEIECGIGNATIASDDNENFVRKAEIVGIVQNSYISETRKLNLKKELDIANDNIFVDVSIYCPLSTLSDWYETSETERYYIYKFDKFESYKKFLNRTYAFSEISSKYGEVFTIADKESLLNNLELELANTKSLLNIIILILCVISGISIISITFFSVKERIPEIGIRKAFGASKIDIAFQFIFEMVAISFIVSIFAVCLSFYCCKFAEGYLATQLFISFIINVSWQQLILPIIVGVMEAVFCSIIPSLYAAKIKVTDSLRFE